MSYKTRGGVGVPPPRYYHSTCGFCKYRSCKSWEVCTRKAGISRASPQTEAVRDGVRAGRAAVPGETSGGRGVRDGMGVGGGSAVDRVRESESQVRAARGVLRGRV